MMMMMMIRSRSNQLFSNLAVATTRGRQRLLVSKNSCSYLFSTNITDNATAADPALKSYKYWNREEYAETLRKKHKYDYLLKISPESVVQHANILNLSHPDDDANQALVDVNEDSNLPYGSKIVGTGTTLSDFDHLRKTDTSSSIGSGAGSSNEPNVVFVSPSCPKARKQLPLVLAAFPSIQWIHVRSAGIDFIVSDALSELLKAGNGDGTKEIIMTNAKGQFSSSLAEYTMTACSYFAKDLPRLIKQKQNKDWKKFDVQELRGKTMGIVGYGAIGTFFIACCFCL
jgi:hypothetical protein